MARIKRLLPVVVATALLFSLLFVHGSIAESLGTGLLTTLGIGSPGQYGGEAQAKGNQPDKPVTVVNTSDNPVPVTVQGTSSQPLTATIDGPVDTNATVQGTVDTNATIDGTVDTRDVNDPSGQPFQESVIFNPLPETQNGRATFKNISVPPGKRLIIRYVSATVFTKAGELAAIDILSVVDGVARVHRIPEASAGSLPGLSIHWYGLETWISADPGTSVGCGLAVYATAATTSGSSADITISGYLVDVP